MASTASNPPRRREDEMAKHSPGVRRHGTARQEAEHDAAYSANGESQYSRQVASTPKLGEGKRTDGRLIREQSGALAKLRFKASIEMDPARLAKIGKDIEIKSKFLAKLKGQYAAEHPGEPEIAAPKISGPPSANWNWEDVTTLEGEDAFEPWDKSKGRRK
jgi:hypothetical protein